APLLINFSGAFLDGKFIVAANKDKRSVGSRSCPRHGILFGFAAVFVNFLQPFGHVFNLAEEGGGNVEGTLLSGGQGNAIAGAGVDLDNFAPQFILLLKDEAGGVSGFFKFVIVGPLYGG